MTQTYVIRKDASVVRSLGEWQLSRQVKTVAIRSNLMMIEKRLEHLILSLHLLILIGCKLLSEEERFRPFSSEATAGLSHICDRRHHHYASGPHKTSKE